jgi:hypothetical protein
MPIYTDRLAAEHYWAENLKSRYKKGESDNGAENRRCDKECNTCSNSQRSNSIVQSIQTGTKSE